MTIRFLCNFVTVYGPGGWSPESVRLGGTEESIVEWARELASRGHQVEVYHNGSHGHYDGVSYLDIDAYHGSDGVTINIKSAHIPAQEPTWYLTNEMDARRLDLSQYTGVILPSRWAVDHLGVKHPNIQILPHGYNSDAIFPEDKILKQCLYSASPDRGLQLALEAWPSVYQQHPDATLIITYGFSGAGPGILAMGDVEGQLMNELYRTSDVWVYPCTGGELFGMTAIKAQAAGCVPFYFPTMALAETVKVGVKTTPQTSAEDWAKLLSDQFQRRKLRQQLAKENFANWVQSTDRLLEIINLK